MLISWLVCNVIINGGSFDNLVSKERVAKLNLEVYQHLRPYQLKFVQEKRCTWHCEPNALEVGGQETCSLSLHFTFRIYISKRPKSRKSLGVGI